MSFGYVSIGAYGQRQLDQNSYSLTLDYEGTAYASGILGNTGTGPVNGSFATFWYSIPKLRSDDIVAIRVKPSSATPLGALRTPHYLSGGDFGNEKRFGIQVYRAQSAGAADPGLEYRVYRRGAVADVGFGINIYGPTGDVRFSSNSNSARFKGICTFYVPTGFTFPEIYNFYTGGVPSDYLIIPSGCMIGAGPGPAAPPVGPYNYDVPTLTHYLTVSRFSDTQIVMHRDSVRTSFMRFIHNSSNGSHTPTGPFITGQDTVLGKIHSINFWDNASYPVPASGAIEAVLAIR
jgi:hypothetical protein